MLHLFAKSQIGYQHVLEKKLCQDFTSLYKDVNRTIITCCDGHGGKIYVRSHLGANMAANAIINVLSTINYSFFRLSNEEIENKIKLSILCEWNNLVEQHLSQTRLKKSEISNLSSEEIESIKNYPAKMYGTTLTGAMLYNDILVCVAIGDSECVGFKNGNLIKIFSDEDEIVGNITYSMCQEDAYKYLKVKVIPFKLLDGIILCSDGLTACYQSYDNFTNSFIKPLVKEIIETKSVEKIDLLIDSIAKKLGCGDDVSLSFIINDKINAKHYE